MAIFRGTGGSVGSTNNSIVSAVTTQAGIATTKAGEASASATTATTKASEASASATTASTEATEATASATTASTKATEANTAKTGAETAQTAAESARDTAQTHANTANNSSVQTVAGISTQVQNVNNIRTEIQNVDTIKTDVSSVSGLSDELDTIVNKYDGTTNASGDNKNIVQIDTVADNIASVNNVGNNIANVNAVHSNASNINTVAADGTDIGTVSSNISNVNTVAGISSNVTTVAGLEAKMDTVIADASDIGAVAGNIGDVSTVAGINADVDTVAGISAKVTTVADNITDVQNADTNAANASTSASQAANSASAAGASATTASTKATEASNSATAASNSATTATTKATEAAGSATTAGTSASTATTKASEANASATTATTKAGEAVSSASAASGDATTSTTKASEASASATSAATSATNAQTAANAWSGYFNTYLGSYSAPPTVDSQGNALQTGAFYYDTGAGSNTVGLYVYNGSAWVYSTNYNNVTAPYSLAQHLATNSYDITFGDNSLAKFGASNDLQISHNSATNRNIIRTNTDSALMFHNNSSNVGSSDEVVVGQFVANTEANNQGFRSILSLQHSQSNANKAGRIVVESNSSYANNVNMYLQTGHSTSVAPRDRIKIANNGDISFFEDTGTTPKFFWDASEERLGIGTTSPSNPLHIKATTNTPLDLETTHAGGNSRLAFSNENYRKNIGVNNDGQFTLFDITNSKSPFVIANNVNSNTFVINGSSNVGIGTNAPDAKLDVVGDIASTGAIITNGIVSIESATPRLRFKETDLSGNNFEFRNSGGNFIGRTSSDDFATQQNRMVLKSNGDVQFYEDTGTTPKLFWDASTERLGIGNNNPQESLHTAGNIRLGDTSPAEVYTNSSELRLGVDRNNDNDTSNITFYTNNDEKVCINKDGKVGIGTSSPDKLLDLESSTNPTVRLSSSKSGSFTANEVMSSLEFHSKDASGVGAGVRSAIRSLATDTFGSRTELTFSVTGVSSDTEAMRIDSNSNVGIGTTGPAQALHVYHATDNQVATFESGDSTSALKIKDNTDETLVQNIGGIQQFVSNNTNTGTAGTRFLHGGSEKMRIDSLGRLGIGTTSPTQFLHVNSGATNVVSKFESSDAEAYIQLKETGGSTFIGSISGATTFYSDEAFTERMRIASNGNVGIGRTSPITELEVLGKITASVNNSGGFGFNRGGSFNQVLTKQTDDTVVLINKNNSPLLFKTNNAERMRIDASGHVIVPAGITLGTAAGTYNAAKTLDDYEEGTWTPTASTNVTGLSSVHGTYTKVGRLVTVNFTCVADLTSISQFNIGGLPFAVRDNLNNTAVEATGIVFSGGGGSPATFMSYASHNSTQLVISTTLSGSRADNQQYRGSITYQT